MDNHLKHRLQHLVPRRVRPTSKPQAYPHHPSGSNHLSNQCAHGHTQKGSKDFSGIQQHGQRIKTSTTGSGRQRVYVGSQKQIHRLCKCNHKQLLTHLFATYEKIGTDLRINNTRMNTAYDVNLPIEILFGQIKDRMDYADAYSHPKTPEQIVMIGQQLLTETGMFTDDLKRWNWLPVEDRT